MILMQQNDMEAWLVISVYMSLEGRNALDFSLELWSLKTVSKLVLFSVTAMTYLGLIGTKEILVNIRINDMYTLKRNFNFFLNS